MNVTAFEVILVVATVLCSLVAGFLFAFAVVVMPGIKHLDDGAFIRAFQAVDRIIQNNDPLFLVVWVGSVLALVTAAVLGVWALSGFDRLMMMGATLLYVFFVQLPTFTINIPLNNELQRLDAGAMNEAARQNARSGFEARWNRWNRVRTACASLAAVLLMLLLLRI